MTNFIFVWHSKWEPSNLTRVNSAATFCRLDALIWQRTCSLFGSPLLAQKEAGKQGQSDYDKLAFPKLWEEASLKTDLPSHVTFGIYNSMIIFEHVLEFASFQEPRSSAKKH